MKAGMLFVQTEELVICWGENKKSITIKPMDKKKEIITLNEENWGNKRVFLREVLCYVLNSYLLSKNSEKKIKEAFHKEMDNVEDSQKKYSEEDIRFFIHMAYIAGVKVERKEIVVNDVDLLVKHLKETIQYFKDNPNNPFYEVVGEFAEKYLKQYYMENSHTED